MPKVRTTGAGSGTGAPFPDGSAASPSINFINALTTGFFKSLDAGLRFQFRRIIGIDALLGGDGNASLPGYTFVSDADSGMFSAGANLVGWATAGVERLRLTTGQLLGANGALATPFWSFLLDTDTGIFRSAADTLNLVAGGVSVLQAILQAGVAISSHQEAVEWQSDTPAAFGVSQNNFNPGDRIVSRISASAAALSVTGIAATGTRQLMRVLVNVGANAITLTNEDAASTAANRFHFASGANRTLGVDDSIMIWYDPTTLRWRDLAAIAA